MDEKQYANIMEAIAMNANDTEYTQLEHFMRKLLEVSLMEGDEHFKSCEEGDE